jgi:hypothetical protein
MIIIILSYNLTMYRLQLLQFKLCWWVTQEKQLCVALTLLGILHPSVSVMWIFYWHVFHRLSNSHIIYELCITTSFTILHMYTHTHTCTHFCLHLWILHIYIVVAMVDNLLLCQEKDIFCDVAPTYYSQQHIVPGKSHCGCTALIPVLNSWKQ